VRSHTPQETATRHIGVEKDRPAMRNQSVGGLAPVPPPSDSHDVIPRFTLELEASLGGHFAYPRSIQSYGERT
jgi:hypothetical protein